MKGFNWFILGIAAGLAIALIVDKNKPIVISETSSVNIVERQFEVADFTGVKVGGAFNIHPCNGWARLVAFLNHLADFVVFH